MSIENFSRDVQAGMVDIAPAVTDSFLEALAKTTSVFAGLAKEKLQRDILGLAYALIKSLSPNPKFLPVEGYF